MNFCVLKSLVRHKPSFTSGLRLLVMLAALSAGKLRAAEELPDIPARARQVAEEFTAALKHELMSALAEKGPAHAVQVCNKRARIIAQEILMKNEEVLEIRRLSRKYRNPRNAPTPLETEALKHFELAIANGKTPEREYVQEDAAKQHFYQPIQVGTMCLTCHGSEEQIPQPVKEILQNLYPEDMATGYQVGDLRGLLKVTLKHKDSLNHTGQ